MKFSVVVFLVAAFTAGLFSCDVTALAAGPTREEMMSAQTDGLGLRRGKKREDEGVREPMRMDRNRDADTTSSAASGSSTSRASGPSSGSEPSITTSSGGTARSGIVTGLGAPAAGG